MTGAASCSVVVATRDRGAKIVPLLESLRRSDLDDFELVVVDQSADDATRTAMEPYLDDERFTYFHSATPGASRSRNLGIGRTTASLIAITDDDCTVPPDWLRQITSPLIGDRDLGVVFCSVVPMTEGGAGHTPHIVFERDRRITSVGEAWRAGRSGLCLGAGMAMRRAAFDDVGGFDEALGPGARFGASEDNDLSWRALEKGWATLHTGRVEVVHDGFRDLDAFRTLVVRDFYGVGGAAAKYLRTGRWRILGLVGWWLLRFGVLDPIRQVASGSRPTGFRRPYMLLRGLIDGLRLPVDRDTLMFVDESEVGAPPADGGAATHQLPSSPR